MSSTVPNWKASGDWFDVCSCNIPCPCIFAQSPTNGVCEGVLAYHIRNGHYGETSLDGLNILGLSYFKGNIWAGETRLDGAFFFDERANQQQRDALQMIFTGKAGGFMAEFGKLIGDMRGIDYAPIKFKVADDLSYWSAEIPGKVVAKAEALTGPMTPSGKRVQTLNAPGSEVGPGTVATWGKAAGIIISILFHNYKELKECISEVEQIEEANVNNKKIQSLPEKEEERVDKKPSVKQICMTDWID